MNSNGGADGGDVGGRVDWAVVGSDIGPLLLAATDAGLVSVGFHAGPAVRDTAVGQLRTRLGTEPVEAPGSGRLAEPIRQLAEYFAGSLRSSRSTWTGR